MNIFRYFRKFQKLYTIVETALNADKKYFAAHGHEISSRQHVRSYLFFRIAQQGNCFPTCY